MTTAKTNYTELLNALVLIGLAGWIWWYSADFPSLQEGYPGPNLFPRVVAAGFMICGLLLLPQVRSRVPGVSVGGTSLRRVLMLVAGLLLVAAFPFLQERVDFIVSLGIICACFGLLLSVVWWKALLTATLTALFVYLVFVKLLAVPL